VLVTDAYGGTGGIARYNRDFLEALSSHRNVREITVLPRIIAREPEPLPGKVTHVQEAASSKASFFGEVVRRTIPGNFNLIVCSHVNLLPLGILASGVTGSPLVLLVYGAEAWSNPGLLARKMIARVGAVVSISNFTLKRLREWADFEDSQCFILPNAVDLSEFRPAPRSVELAREIGLSGSPVLMTLGRMDASERAKGFDEVLEILPELIREFPNIVYCAAGDGSDRRRLMAKAAALGVNEHVIFPGYVDESDKPALYRLADVYVMPSRLEGFGFVFLEALASGVPVIASNKDGGREAVRDGRWGLLADPDDPTALKAAIMSALSSNHTPPRHELEYFSSVQFKRRCEEILDKLLGTNSSHGNNELSCHFLKKR